MAEKPGEIRSGEVYGLDGDGRDFLSQWRQALINMNKALLSQGATPPQLKTVSVKLCDVADWDRDPVQRDLMFREVMGGNIPEFIVSLEKKLVAPEALLSVEGHADAATFDSDEVVYKAFTRAELNREYSARAAVPEHMEIFADWRRRGQRFRERRTAEISYGAGTFEKIDLYFPEQTAGKPPLHTFIHGGYWQAMDKLEHGFLLESLLDRGIAVALINYDLCPKVTIDHIVNQCRTACVALYRWADRCGYDADNFHISGHSAGGHLGGMLAATNWAQIDTNLPVDLVKSVTLISGLYDLEPLRHTGMNRALGLTVETAQINSVIHRTPTHDLPVVLAVGGDESSEFHRQSALLHQAWNGKAQIQWVDMPGCNHFTVVERLNDPDSALYDAVMNLMDKEKRRAEKPA